MNKKEENTSEIEDSPGKIKSLIVSEDTDIKAVMESSLSSQFGLSYTDDLPDLPLSADDMTYKIMIIDTATLGERGAQFCRDLRTQPQKRGPAIILILDQSKQSQGAQCVDCGADDYIAKPLSDAILLSRINAVLRRTGTNNSSANPAVTTICNIELDHEHHCALVGGKPISLDEVEYVLLKVLWHHTGEFVPHHQIQPYLPRPYANREELQFKVRKLKVKLGEAGKKIQTAIGFGLRLSHDD